MCGRYSLKTSPAELEKLFGVAPPAGYRPRYNIAPTQEVLAVTAEQGEREARLLKWGLVPFWAEDPSIGSRMINARAETVADKPAYRNALAKRRCLIPADGFYEWQKRDDGKHPMRVRLHSEGVFAFAGLWERWDRRGRPLETCTILTTTPNPLMSSIHDRMPVILDEAGRERWLAADTPRDDLLALLRPWEGDDLEAYEVSSMVNSPAHDIPECLDPLVL